MFDLDLKDFADMASMKRGHVEMVLNLDLKRVFADPNQPRKEFDENSIAELAADIKRNGLIQPIVVKYHPDRQGDYLLVAGERRLRAVQKLGQSTIAAVLKKDYTQKQDLGYIQIAENLKRDDLKFYELAEFILSRLDKGETQEQIASQLGIAQPRVALYTSWKTAPDFLREARQHFKAMKSFAVLAKLTQDYLQEIQDYVSKLEADTTVTEAEANRLKRQLEGKNHQGSVTSAEPSTLEGITVPANFNTTDQSHANSGGNDTPAPQDTPAGNASPATTSLTDSTGPSDAPATTHGGSDGQTTPSEGNSPIANSLSASTPAQGTSPSASGPAVSYPSFEGRLQPGSNSGDEQQTSQSDTEHPAEGSDQVQNAVRYKKPQLLGTVDSRPATLLYREMAEQDDLVVVRYEDGTRSQVQAKRFVLCRICEG